MVLGPRVSFAGDLAACEATVAAGGMEIDRGLGRDALGGPLVPFAFLANHLCRRGGGLREGDLVMTGSLVTTQFPREAQAYRFSVAGLGAVDVAVVT